MRGAFEKPEEGKKVVDLDKIRLIRRQQIVNEQIATNATVDTSGLIGEEPKIKENVIDFEKERHERRDKPL